MTASDPANVYALPPAAGSEVDSITRPRGQGALIVTMRGRVVLAAESRGKRLRFRAETTPEEANAAVRALVGRLVAVADPARRRNDIVVETIDGEAAAMSAYASVLRDAGFRSLGREMRYYPTLR
jgi:hypothetical protein